MTVTTLEERHTRSYELHERSGMDHRAVGCLEDRPDFLQRESERLRATNESKPKQVRLSVLTVGVSRITPGTQEPALRVVTHHMRRNAHACR